MSAGPPAAATGEEYAPIVVSLDAGRALAWIYRIAATEVHADTPLPQLAPFRLDHPPASPPDARGGAPATSPPFAAFPVRWEGTAWLGGAARRLICRGRGPRAVLRVAGAPDVGVDTASGRISLVAGSVKPAAGSLLADVVTGPALALTLAGRGIFCLHAGAVTVNGCARVFLGESGIGKSTLVREPPAGSRLLADDILPVAINGAAPRALLPFPQLKLAVSEQPGLAASSGVPLERIVVLEPDPPAGEGLVRWRSLSAADATVTLARHTIAAKLFAPALLERHLGFCARVAAAVPVRAAGFRRDLGQLMELREALLS